MHTDPERRRRYQNDYYRRHARQKTKRAASAKRYRDRRLLRILERDSFTCYYCNKKTTRAEYLASRPKNMQLDHKIPLVMGGSNEDANIAASCRWCNREKWMRPICEECRTWETPVQISATEIQCVKCHALNTFPPGTKPRDPHMLAEPRWVTEDNDAPPAEC